MASPAPLPLLQKHRYVFRLSYDHFPTLIVSAYLLISLYFYLRVPSVALFGIWRFYQWLKSSFGVGELVETLLGLQYRDRSHGPEAKIQHPDGCTEVSAITPPHLYVLIVAYLPNEQEIVLSRLEHAATQIQYHRQYLHVHLAYNSPYPIHTVEMNLQALARRHAHVQVHKIPGSTSKAQNINYLLPSIPSEAVIAIFDTDHYPDPFSASRAVGILQRSPSTSVVQGRCIPINPHSTHLASLVSVEFDKLYAVTHLGRDTLWHTAVFNGANGYWRASLLKELTFDGAAMAEDVEVSFRAIARGASIVHVPEVLSYELAPVTWTAFWRQRCRWAHGWTQASWQHVALIWGKGERDLRQRTGLFLLLVVREWNTHLQVQYVCAGLCMLVRDLGGEQPVMRAVLADKTLWMAWCFR